MAEASAVGAARRLGARRGGNLAQPVGTQAGQEHQRRQQAAGYCERQQVDARLSEQKVEAQQLDDALRPAAGAQEHGPCNVQQEGHSKGEEHGEAHPRHEHTAANLEGSKHGRPLVR